MRGLERTSSALNFAGSSPDLYGMCKSPSTRTRTCAHRRHARLECCEREPDPVAGEGCHAGGGIERGDPSRTAAHHHSRTDAPAQKGPREMRADWITMAADE